MLHTRYLVPMCLCAVGRMEAEGEVEVAGAMAPDGCCPGKTVGKTAHAPEVRTREQEFHVRRQHDLLNTYSDLRPGSPARTRRGKEVGQLQLRGRLEVAKNGCSIPINRAADSKPTTERGPGDTPT